jgi:taurine dioxygenase
MKTMAYETINVTKITPKIGAEISGVDISSELTDQQFDEIHRAFLENQVVVFRNQKLSVDQHKAFGKRFGDLHIHPASPNKIEGHPEILVIKADENSKIVAGEGWHSDVSCDLCPPLGSLLYMHQTPASGGGDTLFLSGYAAYDKLSEPMKNFLSQLTAVHDGDHVYRGRYGLNDNNKTYPSAEHPVIRTHPETLRPTIFVNRGFTTHIPQLSSIESKRLLEMLYDYQEDENFQCRIKWEPNTLVFWDNRCVQHRAMWDYFPNRRYAHRVTVVGDRPYFKRQDEIVHANAAE